MERHIQKYLKTIVTEMKSERKKQKISQKRLAALTGISTQTISRFEQAEENIQFSTVIQLAGALGLHLEIASPRGFQLLVKRLLRYALEKDIPEVADLMLDEEIRAIVERVIQ